MSKFVLLISLFAGLTVSAETVYLAAQYSVPVTNEEDFALNTFTLENYKVDVISKTEAVMSFDLPADMTGVANQTLKFKLKSKLQDNTKILTSTNGKAICKGPWINMQCDFVFKKIATDEAQLKRIVSEKLPADQAAARLKILREFSNDPIGVAKITAHVTP